MDACFHHVVHLFVVDQIDGVFIIDVLLFGKCLKHIDGRNDQRRHKFSAIANHHGLLNKEVLTEACFQHLRRNVFAIAGFEQVFQALGDDDLPAFVDVAAVAGVEPSVGVDGFGGFFRLIVVAFHHRRTLHQYFIILTNLHLHTRQRGANGTQFPVGVGIEAHGGSGFAQAVAYHYVEAYGVEKFCDIVGEHGAGCGEKLRFQKSHGSTQAAKHLLIVVLVFFFQKHRHLFAQALIFHFALFAHCHGALKKQAHHRRSMGNVVGDGGVHLFPEARHRAHAGGVHFFHRFLNVFRIVVHHQAHTIVEAHHAPSQFKNVAQRQKAHR